MRRHVILNALPPVITITGLQLGYLLGGALLTRSCSPGPGLGALLYDSITARDMPVVQATTLLIALAFVLVNIVVDVVNVAARSAAEGGMSGCAAAEPTPPGVGRTVRPGSAPLRARFWRLHPFARDRGALVSCIAALRGRARRRGALDRHSIRTRPTTCCATPRRAPAAICSAPTSRAATCWRGCCGAARVSLLDRRRADADAPASSAWRSACSPAMCAGCVDQVIMRTLDVLFAFPMVLLAIAVAGVLTPGVGTEIIAITVVLIPYVGRLARTATLGVVAMPYIEAARAAGGSPPRHPAAIRAAQRVQPDRGLCDDADGADDRRRLRPELPRPRRAAAGGRLGRDGGRGPRRAAACAARHGHARAWRSWSSRSLSTSSATACATPSTRGPDRR